MHSILLKVPSKSTYTTFIKSSALLTVSNLSYASDCARRRLPKIESVGNSRNAITKLMLRSY
jgi:hypothetical protein